MSNIQHSTSNVEVQTSICGAAAVMQIAEQDAFVVASNSWDLLPRCSFRGGNFFTCHARWQGPNTPRPDYVGPPLSRGEFVGGAPGRSPGLHSPFAVASDSWDHGEAIRSQESKDRRAEGRADTECRPIPLCGTIPHAMRWGTALRLLRSSASNPAPPEHRCAPEQGRGGLDIPDFWSAIPPEH